MANLPTLVDRLTGHFKRKPSSEWLAALGAAGVPAGLVLSIAAMLDHPQVLAREMIVETRHPNAGATRAIGCPMKFSDTPAQIRRPAPLFGEHTREVLTEAGLQDAEIKALLETGAAIQS
jgi:crotonobetainyl-CoA:carnitine CoA-transferase CaiB-like acyl-CoA transferase